MNHCTILCDVCMEPESQFCVGYRTVRLARNTARKEGMWCTDHNDVCSRCRKKVEDRKRRSGNPELTREEAIKMLQQIWRDA